MMNRYKTGLMIGAFMCVGALPFFIGGKEEPAPKKRTAVEELRMQPVIEEDVYICTGSSARKYHKWKGCRGLNKCRGGLKKMPIQNARRIGREPCKICY